MALKIRLQRHGSTHRPFYRMVVTENTARRDGRFVEVVGTYEPQAKRSEDELNLKLDRVDYWKSVGAKPTDTAASLIRKARREWVPEEVAPAAEEAPVVEEAAEAVAAPELSEEAAAPAEEAPKAEAPAEEATVEDAPKAEVSAEETIVEDAPEVKAAVEESPEETAPATAPEEETKPKE